MSKPAIQHDRDRNRDQRTPSRENNRTRPFRHKSRRSKNPDRDQILDRFMLEEEEEFDLIDAAIEEEDQRQSDEGEGEDEG